MVLILFISFVNLINSSLGLPAMFSDSASENEIQSYDFPFVDRAGWNARTPSKKNPLTTPVPYVVIHHSYTPPACRTGCECKEAMRQMQNFHMDDRGWWDIGYNFGVGSDGVAYEGRGWTTLGAHALHFNSVSIGICLIGDWRYEVPPADQIKTAQALIASGVEQGFIQSDYKLVGHRQVRDTECPGDALFNEIKKWKHYSEYPSSAKDLLNLPILSDKVKDVMKGNSTYD
ncbi:hypothetical protein ACJJTC_005965 [Scirpophaga incertulas]